MARDRNNPATERSLSGAEYVSVARRVTGWQTRLPWKLGVGREATISLINDPKHWRDRAEAARQLVVQMGLTDPSVVHQHDLGEDFTFVVLYAKTKATVDYTKIKVAKVDSPRMSFYEINDFIKEQVGRKITIIGACTGTDAHTVGIDAIMNMKGFAGDYGLERYACFEAANLGAQVENAELARVCAERGADAVLVSQVVTQRDVHKDNARQLLGELERLGIRGRVTALLGGPRIDHRLAVELGYDAGFGPGTKPSEVANFIVGAVLKRMGKEMH